MATTATVTQSMRAKSQALLSERSRWSRGTSKRTGVQFWVIPDSSGTAAHWANEDGCTCKGFKYRGLCSHVISVREAAHESALADGWSPIPSDEQASHAAFRARLAAEPTVKVKRSYADLFGPDEFDGNVSAF